MAKIREVGKSKTFRSLTVTLAIAFLSLSVVVLLIAVSLQIYFSFLTQREVIVSQQQIIAQKAANAVRSFVQEKLNMLEATGRLVNLIDSSLSASLTTQEEQKVILEKLLGFEPAFRQIFLLNAQKQEVTKVSHLSSLMPSEFTNQAVKELFPQIANKREPYISHIHIDEVTSEPMVIMTVPVKDVFGDFKGALMVEVNLKFMWDLVGNMKIGNKGLAYVVDRQGKLIAFRDISRVLKGEKLVNLREVKEFLEGEDKIVAEISRGIQGSLVVSTYVPLGMPDWAVVVELPVLEAYQPVIQALKLSVLIIFLSFVLAIVTAIYLAKRITKPIISLRDAAIKIGAGRLDTQIKIKPNDEIGDLASAFNQMTRDLQRTTTSMDNLNREMTERKRAEEQYRMILRTSIDGFWIIDMQGRFLDVNDAYCRLIGYSRNELLKMSISDVETVERPVETAQHIQKIMVAGGDRFETRHRCKDGRFIDIEISANYTKEEDERLFVFLRDITERKRMEGEMKSLINGLKEHQELLKSQKQRIEDSRRAIKNVAEDLSHSKKILEEQKVSVERINKELDDFTYIVSHDLKEPLRSIDAFSKFLEDDYKDKIEDEGKDYIKRIRANAARMQNLIEDLLELSRIERKQNPLDEVEVEELISEVKLRLEYRIKEKNVQVVVSDKLPRITCDRVRLTEVFANLISNAIKFCDKSNPRIEIGSKLTGNFYEFYVKDNGPGIEEQYFNKIFEIFQRLGKREDNEGTGAGLTIVKKIIEMHRGRIWLESKIGEGTTFYFTIPKEKEFILGKKKLGEILIEKKLVAEDDIKKALEEQGKN